MLLIKTEQGWLSISLCTCLFFLKLSSLRINIVTQRFLKAMHDNNRIMFPRALAEEYDTKQKWPRMKFILPSTFSKHVYQNRIFEKSWCLSLQILYTFPVAFEPWAYSITNTEIAHHFYWGLYACGHVWLSNERTKSNCWIELFISVTFGSPFILSCFLAFNTLLYWLMNQFRCTFV